MLKWMYVGLQMIQHSQILKTLANVLCNGSIGVTGLHEKYVNPGHPYQTLLCKVVHLFNLPSTKENHLRF
jgi:hypothetical protein